MKQLLLFCLSLSFFNAVAQQHDNLWLFGYKYGGTVRRMTIDFSKDSLAFDYQPGAVSMIKSGAWVCDSSGALQLVTIGCYIGGATEDTIGNGAGLNPGFQADIFCGYGDLNAHQYGFFLPAPSNNGRYYLVHYNPQHRVQDLMYTLVDMADDDGHPAIIEKNKSIVQDTVSIGGVAAVKHGNGRDWWIVCTVDQSNEY